MDTLLEKLSHIREEATFVKDTKIETRGGAYDVWTEQSILSSLRPLFKKYRVYPVREKVDAYYSDAKTSKVIVYMRMYDLDSDQTIPFTGIGGGFDKIDKDAGMASTYAVKDSFLKLFTAMSGLDSDLNGSDQTDEAVRAEAFGVISELWKKGHFHIKAAKQDGIDQSVEGWMDKANDGATKFYQAGLARLKEGKIQDVANDIHTMRELIRQY